MGYGVHITRKEDWADDGPDISLAEWLAYLKSDPDMRHDGFAETSVENGSVLRVESEGIAVWTAYSGHEVGGNMAWFSYSNDGNITVQNPDKEILSKMWLIAQELGANVQGDDGEVYNANGKEIGASCAKEIVPNRPWWKFW